MRVVELITGTNYLDADGSSLFQIIEIGIVVVMIARNEDLHWDCSAFAVDVFTVHTCLCHCFYAAVNIHIFYRITDVALEYAGEHDVVPVYVP